MSPVKTVPTARSEPEDFLLRARDADCAQTRARYARAGLAHPEEIEPDTQFLLLRQLYRARLQMGQTQEAVEIARQMARVGPLRDIAHHDAARALSGLGDHREALRHQRLAARTAPADRRSFQLWCLATLQHFSGDPAGAQRSLRRALRWSTRDGALLRAHLAWIELESGMAVPGLLAIAAALRTSRAQQGYGQFLLGMIAWHVGDQATAAVYLRAFVRRHASADVLEAMTLREELRRARLALASMESC